MEFVISRASTWGDEKPHKDAYLKKFKTNGYTRFNNGKLESVWEDEKWFIKFDTLEDIIKFINDAEDDIVIGKYEYNKSLYEITIYDDYLE